MSTVQFDQPYSLGGDVLVFLFVIALGIWTIRNYWRSRHL